MPPTPKTRNSKQWTEARYRSFITSCIRGGFRRWPPKYTVLKNASVGRRLNPTSGKMATFYTCAKCGYEYTSTNVQVDHIKPVVDPKVGFVSWDEFIDRLFCEARGLQVLCTDCHTKKTARERKKRKEKQ